MPPFAAAILLTAFIAWLWQRDRVAFGKMSLGLWVPLIWVSINASRPVVYWLATGDAAASLDTGDTAGNPIDRNVYLTLLGLGIFTLHRRSVAWQSARINFQALLLLYAYFLCSILWSEHPFIAFKRWVRDGSDLVMVLIVLTEKDPLAGLRSVFTRTILLLVPLSVLFIKWYPALGRYTHRWTYQTFYSGVTVNKNSLGLLALLGGLFLLWQIVEYHPNTPSRKEWRKRVPELCVFAMCIWLLGVAGSSTAIICFICGSFLILGSRLVLLQAALRRIGWCVAGFVSIILLFTLHDGFRATVAATLGRNATLTDRTDIWAHAITLGTNPVFGAGFASAWISDRAAALVEEYNLAHAHNGYLETYLHTGAVGVALLLIVLLRAGSNVARIFSTSRAQGSILLALYWTGLLQNYSEVTFARSNPLGFLLWFLAAYGVQPFLRRPLQTDHQNDIQGNPA